MVLGGERRRVIGRGSRNMVLGTRAVVVCCEDNRALVNMLVGRAVWRVLRARCLHPPLDHRDMVSIQILAVVFALAEEVMAALIGRGLLMYLGVGSP